MRYRLLGLFLVFVHLAIGQSIVISELSQGTSGSREYIELLVTENNTCGLDLRGYIIDDNNGFFASGAGTGIADGCVRFANDPLWSNVPIGTLITIYNDAEISSPPFPATDISTSDGNCQLVVPISSTLFEGHATEPSVSSGPAYPTTGWVSGGSWADIQMGNGDDSFQIRADGTSNPIHAISWGNNYGGGNGIIEFIGSIGGEVLYFDNFFNNGDYLQQPNFARGAATAVETPNAANTANYGTLLSSIQGTCEGSMTISIPTFTAPDCDNDGIVAISVSGGRPSYIYETTLPGGSVVNSGGTNTIGSLTPGLYEFTVTDANGCTAETTMDFTISAAPSLQQGSITPAQCGCNGSINYSWTGGSAPFEVELKDDLGNQVFSNTNISGNTITINNLCDGNYDLEIEDDNSCESFANNIVVWDTSPTLVFNVPPTTYNATTLTSSDGSATISPATSVTTNLNYSVSGPNGYQNTTSSNSGWSLGGLVAGQYSVTVSDPISGCSIVEPFTIGAASSVSFTLEIYAAPGQMYVPQPATLCPNQAFQVWAIDNTSGCPAGSGNSACALSLPSGWYFDWSQSPVQSPSNPSSFTFGTVMEPVPLTITLDIYDNTNTLVGTSSITVNPYSDPLAGLQNPIPDICSLDTDITYSGFGSPLVTGTFDLYELVTGMGYQPVTGYQGLSALTIPGGLPPGNYRADFDYSYGNGCVETLQDPFFINESPQIQDAGIPVYCPLDPTDDLTSYIVPSGSYTFPGSYSINFVFNGTGPSPLSGSNGQFFDPSTGSNSYSITAIMTDGNSCTDSHTFNLDVSQEPDISSLGIPLTVCGGNSVTLGLLNSGDTWSGTGVTNNGGVFTFSNPVDNTYTLTYTENGNPCTTTFDITVTPSITVGFQPTNNSACVNDVDLQLNQFSFQGGAGIGTQSFNNINWPPTGTQLTVSSSGLVNLSNAVPGAYDIEYTYTEGSCTDSETATIIVHDLPQVLYAGPSSGISLCDDGSVDLQPSFFPSSGGSFTVNGVPLTGTTLNGNASFLTPTNNTVVYSFTDGNGCTDTATETFDLLEAPALSANSNPESCPGANDGSIGIGLTAGATAGMVYAWSTGYVGNPLPNVGAGSYTVTVTNNGGCSTVATYTVTSPTPIAGTSAITHVSSNGGSDGSINLTVSGGTAPYSYNWSAGLPPLEDQVNLTAGIYSVTITDANGCSDVLSSLVVAQPGPLVAQGNQSDVLCFGDLIGSIDITTSGGFTPPDVPSYQYAWSTGSTNEDLVNVGAGIYQVTVTAIPTSTDQEVLSFTITQPSSLSVVGSVTDIICFANSSGAISTTVSGGVAPYTYDWSNGFAIPNIAGLLAGTYSLTVTDNNGCSSTQSWTINQPIGPFNFGFNTTSVACFGDSTGSIQLNMFPGATPPFSFLWSNGSTTQDLTGVPSGLYSVVITDANGCSTVAGAPPVAQPSGPVGSTGNVSDVSSFGAGDGAIVLSTTGGSPGYNYSWIGPNGSFPGGAVISGLDGGTYSVTTTDANGCSSISTFTVNEPGQLIVSGIANDETCLGTADGSIDLSISSNGIPSIIWSNGSTIEDLFGLAVGTYSVTVTDGPQIASLSFTIGTATILNFSLALPTDSFCLADALPLTGTTSNVGATESYKIDGTLVLGTSVPLSTYTVGTHELRYIVSLSGCTDSLSVLFELIEPYPTVPQSSAIVCPTGVNVNLTSLLNAAAMLALPDTGSWFDPSGLSVTSTFDPSAGPYGVYQYQISNFCGTTIYTMDVGAVQNTISFSTPDSLCQNESAIDLNNFVLPAGGTWSGGTTTGLFDPGLASPGAFWFYYSVTSAGCTFTDSVQIQVVASPLVAIDTSLVPVLCTANNSDTLSFGSPPGGVYSSTTASIGQSGLSFILDPQASGAGTHDIQYYFTDPLSGCSDSAQISISISATINTAIGPFSDTLCVGDLPLPLPVGLPTGGAFSGPGVVGNNFSPAAAGVGSHYLRYSFAGDPCYISDSIPVVVTDVPSINMPIVPDLCSSDPAFSLTGASPVGGTWIGNNVVNGQFLPALAGPGTHEIVYYYNSGGNCENYDTTFVTVLTGTSLTLSHLGPFCEGDANLSLSNVSPSGGTYSGPGVVNGVFSPQNAGVGSHSISYTYTNAQGCLTDTIFNILVQPLPMVTLSGQPDFCEGDPPSLLSGGSPAGGIYTGSGVINDTLFDPFVAGQGSHLLTYTYTDSSGCSASISTQIQVYPTPPEPSINKTINFLVCDWGFYDYQWFFDGDSIPNSNNIKWTAADTGYYQVMLINEWGCTNSSDSLFVDIIYPTDLSELEWPELQIYPNPTRGTVSLNLPLRAREIQYKWVNPMGQSLDEGYIPSGDPIQWQYNLSRFASGTYVLVLKSENQILHLRVVLEH